MKSKKKPPPDLSLGAFVVGYAARWQKEWADLAAFYTARAATKAEQILAKHLGDYGPTLSGDMRAAQWMALDDDTVRQLAAWCNHLEPPALLVERALRMARAPFTATPTWIEWRIEPMVEWLTQRAPAPSAPLNRPRARCGFLIRGSDGAELERLRRRRSQYQRALGKTPEDTQIEPASVWTARYFVGDPVTGDGDGAGPFVGPLIFVVSTDTQLLEVLPDAEEDEIDSHDNRIMLLFGVTAAAREHNSFAAKHFALRIDQVWQARRVMGDVESDTEAIERYVVQLAGIGGFLLLMLALLDQASITYVPRLKNSQRIVAGKLIPGHDHRIVRIPIELKPKQVLRYLGTKLASLVRMREHTVRGHWQRYGKPQRWVWKLDFRRGDPTVGVVRHDYSLEPPEDQPEA
jgi:hypothetical protein